MKTDEELKLAGMTKCDFDDTCDICTNPKGGSFAVGYVNDMCGEECDYYICRNCASEDYEDLFNKVN